MGASATNPVELMSNLTQLGNATSCLSASEAYDSYGAMLFIIAVIVVYGVAVIGMLGFYSGKGEQLEDFDKQANSWLKEVEVRQRQLEIKSRKSVFTKRLSELRTDLSHEHGPRLQSHVANYLIASIGMKSSESGDNVLRHPNTPIGKCGAGRVKPSSLRKGGTANDNDSLSQQLPVIRASDNCSSSLVKRLPTESSEARASKIGMMIWDETIPPSKRLLHEHRTRAPRPGRLQYESTARSPEHPSLVTGDDSASINNTPEERKQPQWKRPKDITKGNKISFTDEETGQLLAEAMIVEYESVV